MSCLPDVAIGLMAAVFGLFIYFQVKGTWLSGWMRLFGDPPVDNPSYKSLSPFFFTAPYAVSGVVVGLLSGCGRFRLYPLIVRFLLGPVAIGVLLSALSDPWGSSIFPPMAVKFFCVSVIASALYGFMVSSTERKSLKDETER